MPYKTKADLIGEVLKYLAYRDLDIGPGGEPLIYEYEGPLADQHRVSSEATKQADQHLLLHHGLPVEGDVSELRDDWCFECTRSFLLATLGASSTESLLAVAREMGAIEKLTTQEAATALTMKALRLFDEIQDKRARDATGAVRHREGFASSETERSEAVLKSWDRDTDRVADFYAEWLGQRFSKLIDRAEQLNAIPVRDRVPESVQRYLIEASRCYIFGQFLACLVVCRAAIEFAFGDILERHGQNAKLAALQKDRRDGLSARIDLVRSLSKWKFDGKFDAALAHAEQIRSRAGQALHKRDNDVSSSECKELFVKARGVLQELYS